jgi:ferredoxin
MNAKSLQAKITIDADLCTSSGTCISLAPGTFRHGADHLTFVMEPPSDELEAILKARDLCPMQAIRIET